MAKGEEWGQPISKDALVRQENEKCCLHHLTKAKVAMQE